MKTLHPPPHPTPTPTPPPDTLDFPITLIKTLPIWSWQQWKTQWQHQKVLILGSGASGLSMAKWCAMQGAQVAVVDSRITALEKAQTQVATWATSVIDKTQSSEGLQSHWETDALGRCSWYLTTDFDPATLGQGGWTCVLRSPGLSPQTLHQTIAWCMAHGVPLCSEVEVFGQALLALRTKEDTNSTPYVLAITGTNGKTTVTTLTETLLESAGISVAMAGNIGPALLDVLGEQCQQKKQPQAWVLELSSFQLSGCEQGCFAQVVTAGVVLNLTEDHLDWHHTMSRYAHAKWAVWGAEGMMVIPRQDEWVVSQTPPLVQVKIQHRWQKRDARPYQTIGLTLPTRPLDWGLSYENGLNWLVRAVPSEQEAVGYSIQRLMPVHALRIKGLHNAQNALAALALASSTSASLSSMLHGLRSYRGQPHRVESIGILQGVEYLDDSKGTNVGATLAAITGLGGDRCQIVILGGDGKGQSFAPLAVPIGRHAKAVALIGKDADRIEQALLEGQIASEGEATPTLPIFRATTLQDAVHWAASIATEGDKVLLSPACASMDMFDNYVHRAKIFIQTVEAIASEVGQILEVGDLS